MSAMALPGQVLGPTSANNVGPGTHIQGPSLVSSLAGVLTSKPSTSKANKLPTATVSRPLGDQLIPDVGTIVLGKVTRTNARQAHLSILALGASGDVVCNDPFPAIIRLQDVRATEIDKLEMSNCFRVGDVVRAVVVSLGDERSYFCSTAKNELGVVLAWSESTGAQMVPVSWKEFANLEAGAREGRKVAKVV